MLAEILSHRLSPGMPEPVLKPHRFRRAAINTVVSVVVAFAAFKIASNPVIHWARIAHYFLSKTIISGLLVTVFLTCVCMGLGILLGTALSLMSISKTKAISVPARIYIWAFRGTPVLVQLIFWFNIALFLPTINLGFHSWNTNSVVTPMVAAILALSLNEAAYMSEIIRAGLMSVDSGQREAAETIGLRPSRVLLHVVIPQALVVIFPPTANNTIGMLKTTSLVSVIAVQDLLTKATDIYTQTFETIDLLIVASLWYLVATTVATIGQAWLERRFGTSYRARPLQAATFEVAA